MADGLVRVSPSGQCAAAFGKKVAGFVQRKFYGHVMQVSVQGQKNVPAEGGFLVAANHASHLDAGLVKWALGGRGAHMHALAARDYFFASRLRRWYFENFTNLMAIERHGSFKSTLRQARCLLAAGRPLLIFPEGTRSIDGTIKTFKPAIGSMAMATGSPVLPIYLWGTFDAMPKGQALWPKSRSIGATVGPAIDAAMLVRATRGLCRHEAYRVAAESIEQAVRGLARVSRQQDAGP